MKHITIELEQKIREMLEDKHARAIAMQRQRIRSADIHGEDLPDPMSPTEAEFVGFAMALKWVLHEGNC